MYCNISLIVKSNHLFKQLNSEQGHQQISGGWKTILVSNMASIHISYNILSYIQGHECCTQMKYSCHEMHLDTRFLFDITSKTTAPCCGHPWNGIPDNNKTIFKIKVVSSTAIHFFIYCHPFTMSKRKWSLSPPEYKLTGTKKYANSLMTSPPTLHYWIQKCHQNSQLLLMFKQIRVMKK